MQPKTCCPLGYFYNTTDGLCWKGNNTTDPIECPCCPVGYHYDSVVGLCINDINNITSTDPIPCPCCPPGYHYENVAIPPSYPNGFCQGNSAGDVTSIIPCIPCNCIIPPPPVCPTCGSQGQPVSFSFNPNIKNCQSCTPEDLVLTRNRFLNTFLPVQFISPVINFTYNNKNQI